LPQKGLKAKDLVGIPWRVAFALQADGWYLRQDIIWSKPNPMPESVTDRCTKSHEYIFLLSKSERYHFDHTAILEPAKYSEEAIYDNGQNGLESGKSYAGSGSTTRKFRSGNLERKRGNNLSGSIVDTRGHGFPWEDTKRNKRSVWNVAVRPYKEAHFATFPTELIRPCILAGCPAGSTVLDPFLGSGTTAFVSKELNRKCIGIELNSKYISLAKVRLVQEVLNFNTDEESHVVCEEPPQNTVEQASTDMQQLKVCNAQSGTATV
jgi:DNA modification methylase